MKSQFFCLFQIWCFNVFGAYTAEVPALKLDAAKTNIVAKTNSVAEDKTPPVPEKYQTKTYDKKLITSLPDCYEFDEETPEEKIERSMCEMDTMVYNYKNSAKDVDPAWLYWNSLNPMTHQPIHCQNIAFREEKWKMCSFMDLNYEKYETAVQGIFDRYLAKGQKFLYTVEIDDFFTDIESYYGLPTLDLEREIMDILVDIVYDYFDKNFLSNYSGETGSIDNRAEGPYLNDGAYNYYYYFYYDDNV